MVKHREKINPRIVLDLIKSNFSLVVTRLLFWDSLTIHLYLILFVAHCCYRFHAWWRLRGTLELVKVRILYRLGLDEIVAIMLGCVLVAKTLVTPWKWLWMAVAYLSLIISDVQRYGRRLVRASMDSIE